MFNQFFTYAPATIIRPDIHAAQPVLLVWIHRHFAVFQLHYAEQVALIHGQQNQWQFLSVQTILKIGRDAGRTQVRVERAPLLIIPVSDSGDGLREIGKKYELHKPGQLTIQNGQRAENSTFPRQRRQPPWVRI